MLKLKINKYIFNYNPNYSKNIFLNLLYMDNHKQELNEDEVKSFQSLLVFNDNLRKHIKLSLSIYKKLNNFDHKYIHQIINE